MAIAEGPGPAGIALPALPVATSIGVTVFDAKLAT
jgi:hypothetical protein